ncbi:MAG: hypothetical protein KAX28_00655 [Candidatus Marinimicrobia bacterium]|nr:hypothetical protein [Candidatus Neomarinimicrobiota bacterium]
MKDLENIANFIGTHGLITLLVFFIGAPLAYYFNIKANKRKLAHEAFKEFEKTFTPALHLLDDPKQTSYIIVANEFPKNETAMLAFEHILRGTKSEDRFKAKWTEYKNKGEEIRQYGYSIYLGEKAGPPSIGILEHIQDREGNFIEIEPDRAYKEKLKKLINELLEIAKH